MAAAPEGAVILDYEAEEAAILEAAETTGLSLFVEESGALIPLRQRLSDEGHFQALHLSCHGDIYPEAGPMLALENELGDLDLVDIKRFVAGIGGQENLPPLIFLSACRSAEHTQEIGHEPFARAMIRAGVPNVLGWDGSVSDADAISYAQAFYKALAQYDTVTSAAMTAQRELRRIHQDDVRCGQHWHLPRLYLGATGGGKLVGADRIPHPPLSTAKEFLDPERKVPVASNLEFVGRRRPLQKALRLFRNGQAAVLIHGLGCHGKSTLAYRITDRMRGTLMPLVIFGDYDVASVFNRLLAALPPKDRALYKRRWQKRVKADPQTLNDAMEDLLGGPFHERPILLIIDDLEQILEKPQPNTAIVVQLEYRAMLSALLKAFAAKKWKSRLLLTSRFRFTLFDNRGRDLARSVEVVPLGPMNQNERLKQWKALERAIGRNIEIDEILLQRAIAAAFGNPGIQDTLTRPIATGEAEAARKGIEAVERYLEQGMPATAADGDDAGKEVVDLFRRLAFNQYRAALSKEESTQLSATLVIGPGFPVPSSAMEAAGRVAGVKDPAAAVIRLCNLGLFDEWEEEETASGQRMSIISTNPLAYAMAEGPSPELVEALANATVTVLGKYWRHPETGFPMDWRTLEVARLALEAGHQVNAALLNEIAEYASRFLYERKHDAPSAYHLTQLVVDRLSDMGVEPRPGLWLLHGRCAQFLGDLDQAMEALRKSAKGFGRGGEEREQAIAWGDMADILEGRWEFDKAFWIRNKKQLPVYDRLGDDRERAITMGKIADILLRCDKLSKSLRILKEEVLPVFERLDDMGGWAIAMGKIAQIWLKRGKLDKSMRILEEEVLPVLECFGTARDRTSTMAQIADILQMRGKLGQALLILKEEVLPVCERLGATRERTFTLTKIADILAKQKKPAEALEIYQKQVLPAFLGLDATPAIFWVVSQIAALLEKLGRVKEAAAIRKNPGKYLQSFLSLLES